MDDHLKQKLMDKNQRLIAMVIERAKRDFSDDIALIGLTGSFSTNDFHEKSDLDLIIVNNTDKGWGIAECFIYDDVGYDIYCTSWENLEQKAALENPGVSSLTDLKILYCSKPEHQERFNTLREQALEKLAEPIGIHCISRAKKHIDLAKQEYANTLLSDNQGEVRRASCELFYHLVNSLVSLNNTCIKRGIKRYLEELLTYQYLPDNFERLYRSVIEAKTVKEIRSASLSFLSGVNQLYDILFQQFNKPPVPTYDNLRGTYEELWCNCRNKVILSTGLKDKSYAFFAAMGAQGYLDEMTSDRGTKKFDLLQYFDADHLEIFEEAFLKAMDEYRAEYDKVGRSILKFDTFEALYEYYMKR